MEGRNQLNRRTLSAPSLTLRRYQRNRLERRLNSDDWRNECAVPPSVRILARSQGEGSTSLPAGSSSCVVRIGATSNAQSLSDGTRGLKPPQVRAGNGGYQISAVPIGPSLRASPPIAGTGGDSSHSLRTSVARLSSRSPINLLCRKCPSGVNSTNSNWPTSLGLSQRHSFILATVRPSPAPGLLLGKVCERTVRDF